MKFLKLILFVSFALVAISSRRSHHRRNKPLVEGNSLENVQYVSQEKCENSEKCNSYCFQSKINDKISCTLGSCENGHCVCKPHATDLSSISKQEKCEFKSPDTKKLNFLINLLKKKVEKSPKY